MFSEEILNLIVNIGTIACLVLLALNIGFLLINLIGKRPRVITFMRNYKAGDFALVYITVLLIYFIGSLNITNDLLLSFTSSVTKAADFIVLKIGPSDMIGFVEGSVLYEVAVYVGYVLMVVNTVLFSLSIIHQRLWCAKNIIKLNRIDKEKLYIFGNNADNIALLRSDGKQRIKVIIDDMTKEECEKLYIEGVPYMTNYTKSRLQRDLFGSFGIIKGKAVFVINTGDDNRNITLCRNFVEKIESATEKQKNNMFSRIRIYVFGNPKYQAIYENMVDKGLGCIHYVNKYQKMAIDFIDRYPLSLFMNERQIDFDTSLVKANVEINTILIGFGKMNQQVFLTSVANNQFLTESAKGPKLKPVNYFVFDKEHSENNKNLNHNYYRFKHELLGTNEEDYLPMPDLPANEKYHHLDINDATFYDEVKAIVTRNPDDANFIVIAFGNDLENLDMAEKLIEKRKEWGLTNLNIFVRVRIWHKEQTLLEKQGCYFIGNDRDCVFNIEKLLGDKITKMAMMRDEIYEIERAVTKEPSVANNEKKMDALRKLSNVEWFKGKSPMERESSLYCCLSLRSKLNMMNLDYCPKSEAGTAALKEKEYLSTYAGKDKPCTNKYSVKIDGKDIVYYDIDFADSRRRTMAIQEHQRWNSFMISRGIVPATKQQIINETGIYKGKVYNTNGKNYDLRRHGNLTTFDGLVEFRKMIARRDKKTEVECDKIKFDYQILDDAYWLLDKNGYAIINKREPK